MVHVNAAQFGHDDLRTVKFPSGNFSGFSFPAASVLGRFQIPVHPQKFPVARLRELPIQVIDLPRPALLCDDGFLGEGDISLYFAAECKAGAALARRQVGTPTVACVTIASPRRTEEGSHEGRQRRR